MEGNYALILIMSLIYVKLVLGIADVRFDQ